MTSIPIKTPAPDIFAGMHYVLAGYVARGGIKPPPQAWIKPDGSVLGQSFTVIMQNRPKDCRFAVAQIIRMRTAKGSTKENPKFAFDDCPSGPFIVWDLHDDQLTRGQRTGPGGLISPPAPMWLVPNKDGALMKALAFYEHAP